MSFEIDPAYKTVPERVADFRAKHPSGCLRPVDPGRAYWFETLDDKVFVVYAAAAYRTPDDPCPGIGVAWEPYPGRTPYTRDSELQNAETSAWGRAIIAVLASEAKTIASAEEVRNRAADNAPPPPAPRARRAEPPAPPALVRSPDDALKAARRDLGVALRNLPLEVRDQLREWCAERDIPNVTGAMNAEQVQTVVLHLKGLPTPRTPAPSGNTSPDAIKGQTA